MAKATTMLWSNFVLPQPLIALPPELPPYWTRERDDVLASTLEVEDKWANAVAIATTKCAAMDYQIDGEVALRRNRSHEILGAVDGMQGWAPFIAKHMQDFLCSDNGAFIEIVRAGRAVGSRIVGLLHLDSRRCYRTGDPEIPVLYRDRVGGVHELRAHQVIAIADMPTPRLTFNGVGRCAADRVYQTIYRMAVIERYIAEKVAGRRPQKIVLVSGMNQKQVDAVMRASQEEASARGLLNYMGVAITAVPTDGEISTVEIELAGLPDNFDLEKERANARLEYANAIGLDIQDLQPGAIGGSLGSSTQSQVLDTKADGKGLAYWRKAFTEQLNLKVLPDATTFTFIETDYRDEKARADAAAARETVRASMIGTGQITPRQALQMAVDDGDAPAEFIDQDTTPHASLASGEKPAGDGAALAPAMSAGGSIAGAFTEAFKGAREPYIETLKERHTGAMVALYPTPEVATVLATPLMDWPDGSVVTPSSEMHVTLTYLGEADDIPVQTRTLQHAYVDDIAAATWPLPARFNGVARFNGGDSDAVVVLLDSREINELAHNLRSVLGSASDHEFLAHITLAYIPKDAPTPTIAPMFDLIYLDRIGLAYGGVVETFPLDPELSQTLAGAVAKAFKANRTELVRIAPQFTRPRFPGAGEESYLQQVTRELRGYMQLLAEKAREHCPEREGTLRASIRYELKGAGTREVEGVLYAGNAERPEVVVRSNLFGRRGFGPKDPEGVLAFENEEGDMIFTTHVDAADPDNWLARAWKETEPERTAMARRIGRLGIDKIAAGDVPLANAEHIDGYDERRGETVPNTPHWRRAGGLEG